MGLPVGFLCSGIQFYLLLSPYLCFISFLYLDLYVLRDTEDIVYDPPCQQSYSNPMSLKIHYYHPFYLLQSFTFSIQIMFSLILSDANDPQGLKRR